jgi:esterase
MRVNNDGVSLNVEVDGPKGAPAVLLLHGLSSVSGTYGFLVLELASRYQVYRLDYRGHGHSDRVPGGYQLDGYASDVVAVLEAAIGRPAALVGHSLGGVSAFHVAQHRPELVTGVFLEDPPLFLGDKATFDTTPYATVFSIVQAAVRRWQAEGAGTAQVAEQLANAPSMTGAGTLGEENNDDALAAMAEGYTLLDPAVYDSAIDDSALASFDPSMPVGAPGLLLQADARRGAAFFGDHAARLEAVSPSVEIVVLEGVGHLIHNSRSHRAQYVDRLHRFLEAHAHG